MGQAVGLDLGAATSVAARLRGDDVETAVLVPTADLGVGAISARHRLESLAARAVDGGALPAVGVAIPALERDSEAEIGAAAREAFADPLLVLRPAAAAAWFRHTNEVHPDALLVMVEADETQVAVTLVRPGPRIPAIERATVGEPLSSGAPVLDAIDTVAATLTAAGLVPTALDVAVIVGSATWLDGLAEGITAATDLAAVVDPEPRAAVAYGAALLAEESDGFGVGTAVALGVPVVGAGLAATAAVPEAAPPLGAGLGEAAGALGGSGTGLGAAMHAMGQGKDAPIQPLGADVGDAVGGYKEPPSPRPGEGGEGGGSPKRPPSRLPAGGLKRSLVLGAPALVAVLVVGGLTVRSCTQNPDTTTLATSSAPADPDDPSTTGTTGTGNAAGPGGGDKPAPLAPTSSEPTTPSTSTTSTRRTPTTPGAPSASTPVAPPTDPVPPQDTTAPSITGLGRSPSDIYADNGECNLAMTTVLSATITDDSGVAGATVRWSSSRSQGGPLTMAPDGNNGWSATLGPLADGQLTFTTETLLITWRVTAFDAAGNSTGDIDAGPAMAVKLHGCIPPIG